MTSSNFSLRYRPALIILLLGLAAHLPAVFLAEMTGEDELLFNHIAHMMIAALLGIPNAWQEVLRFYYPPLQSLLSTPLIGLFGTSTWTLRLPGALAGAAAAAVLFLTLDCLDRRVAWIAALLAAGAGVVANHHYALTCGLYSVGAALCAWGLVRFINSENDLKADTGLLVGALGLVWAMMTLPDAYFHLPVLALAYLSKRGFRFNGAAWGAIVLITGWMVLYGFLWFVVPAFFRDTEVGGHLKVESLLSQLGTVRFYDLVHAFAAGSSWFMLVISVALLPVGWRVASRGVKWMVGFYAFPLFLWTFVFDYPNVRAAHMLLAFPGYATLWAAGAIHVLDYARSKSVWAGHMVRIIVLVALSTAFYQTAVLHVVDWLPQDRIGPRWLVLKRYYPQGRRVQILGQAAAGWWVRQTSNSTDGVSSNLGGAFSDFYARRPHFALDGLEDWFLDTESAQLAGVRFYAHSLLTGLSVAVDLDDRIPALEVRHRNQAILKVYDLWQEHTESEVMDAKDGKRLWRQLNRTGE